MIYESCDTNGRKREQERKMMSMQRKDRLKELWILKCSEQQIYIEIYVNLYRVVTDL